MGISVIVLHTRPQLLHHLINSEASRRLAGRKFFERHQELADNCLRRHEQVNAIKHPVVIIGSFIRSPLVGIGAQVFD
jgi:hypothetical protein